jgi:hypothetical protein
MLFLSLVVSCYELLHLTTTFFGNFLCYSYSCLCVRQIFCVLLINFMENIKNNSWLYRLEWQNRPWNYLVTKFSLWNKIKVVTSQNIYVIHNPDGAPLYFLHSQLSRSWNQISCVFCFLGTVQQRKLIALSFPKKCVHYGYLSECSRLRPASKSSSPIIVLTTTRVGGKTTSRNPHFATDWYLQYIALKKYWHRCVCKHRWEV